MKKILFYFLASISLFFILLFSACKKNIQDAPYNPETIKNGLSVTEARKWYEQIPRVSLRTTTNNKANFNIRTPNWEKTIQSQDSNYYVIELPVLFEKTPGFTFTNLNEKSNPEKANDAARLLILKNKNTGTMRSALMHIVSDNGNSDNISSYGKINKNFSGFVFFTNLDGTFINGYKYEKGKITGKTSKSSGLKKTSKRIGLTGALSVEAPPDPGICTTVTVTLYTRTCTYYPNGEVNCTAWHEEDSWDETSCTGGSSGGGTGGTGGGNSYIQYNQQAPNPLNNNQDIIDSLKNHPCAQEILKQLPSLNQEVDSILQKIFGANEDVNLTFSVDNSLTKDSLDGYTKFPGGSASFFDSKIELNPWVLENSTKEYILVTMLHEAIHSYIDYWYNQYLTKQIDSTTFKNRFPIFWDYKKTLKDPVEIAQHNAMANNYINTMTNAIKSYNPNASNEAAEALAWGGLQETTVWKSKTDTTTVIDINMNSRNVNLNKFSQYNFQKCGGIMMVE